MPFYLAIGMTAEEYWNGDPWLAKAYRKAWRLKEDETNFEAWLQGLYNYQALAVVVGNALRKKGAKAENYFVKPIDLREEEKPKTVEQIRQEVYDQLQALEEKWNGKQRSEHKNQE